MIISRGSFFRTVVFALIFFYLFAFADYARAQFVTEEEVRLQQLYRKATDFSKKGLYRKAIKITEKILKLIDTDLYLNMMCRASMTQPDKQTLDAALENFKQRQADYLLGKAAFRNKDYLKAEELFLSLSKESPDNRQVQSYLTIIASEKHKQALMLEKQIQEQMRQQEAEKIRERREELDKVLIKQEQLEEQRTAAPISTP